MCVFCNIIKHKAEAKIVYETEKVIAFLDIEPISDGHVLVLPKFHADSITKIPQDYLMEVIETAKAIVNVFENDYHHAGYSIMQNGGECCDFGHFHLHVFPRVKGDGFGWTYPEKGGQFTDEIASDLREKISNQISCK
ncbi:MAG: HIT family protein [Eubacteriales bacterium]|nr:HIT family protein [Eubacteriales bacterium]